MQKRPFVTWGVITTIDRHKWWDRVLEYIQDPFPADHIELIILGTQEKKFQEEAEKRLQHIARLFRFSADAQKKIKTIRILEKYHGRNFKLCKARNHILHEAKGEIIIHRDADCRLLQWGFTEYVVRELLRHQVGLLGVPSLRNGFHFKPKEDKPFVVNQDLYPDLRLIVGVHGMTTVSLVEIERMMQGRNEAMAWGEHNALSVKMARAGFLLAYAVSKGYWLATDDSESSISITDERRNPKAIEYRELGCRMLNRFYHINEDDIFWKIQQSRYAVNPLQAPSADVANMIQRKYRLFSQFQTLDAKIQRYDFKPWECLSHKDTEKYIKNAKTIASPFFTPILNKVRKSNMMNL